MTHSKSHAQEKSIAYVVEDAVALPGFAEISMETLGRIVSESAKEGRWSEELCLALPCAEQGDKDAVTCAVQRSAPNSQGFYLSAARRDNGAIDAYVYMNTGPVQRLVRVGESMTALIDYVCAAKAWQGPDVERYARDGALAPGTYVGWRGWYDFVPQREQERFRHGVGADAEYRYAFRTRLSAVHRQALALVRYYAGKVGTPTDMATAEDACKYFRDAGCTEFAQILREFLARNFKRILEHEPAWFLPLRCSELESLIAHDRLRTCGREVSVLRVVIDWARHKDGRVSVGDEVRVRSDCEHVQWRGADCMVKCVQGRLVQVERIRTGEVGASETLEFDVEQLHDAGRTGMMRLVPMVRCVFIRIDELRTELRNAQVGYAAQYAEYRELVKRVVEVRTLLRRPEELGRQALCREDYGAIKIEDATDTFVRVLTHSEDDSSHGDVRCSPEQCVQAQGSAAPCVHHDPSTGPRTGQCTGEQLQCPELVSQLLMDRLGEKDSCVCNEFDKLVAATVAERLQSREAWDKLFQEGPASMRLEFDQLVAERVQQQLLSCDTVERLVAQRMRDMKLVQQDDIESLVMQRVQQQQQQQQLQVGSTDEVAMLAVQRIQDQKLFSAEDVERMVAERVQQLQEQQQQHIQHDKTDSHPPVKAKNISTVPVSGSEAVQVHMCADRGRGGHSKKHRSGR
jgi:hypothetical protein